MEGYELKKQNEVAVSDTAEGAKVLIEQNGEIRRIDKDLVGEVDVVKTVNGVEPDADGNVEVSYGELKDKPFGEEKVVIEWDRDISAGSLEFAGTRDLYLGYEGDLPELATGDVVTAWMCGSGGPSADDLATEVPVINTGDGIIGGSTADGNLVFVICTVDGYSNESLGTLPKKGVYFKARPYDGSATYYIYKIECESVKRLDPKFIPFAANVMKVTFVNKGMVGGWAGTPVFEPSHTLNDVLTAITMAGKTVIGEVVDDSGAGTGLMMGPACLGTVDSESMCVYFPLYDSEAEGAMLPTNCLRLSSYSTYAELISAT